MAHEGNDTTAARWRIQILTLPPQLIRMGEEVPVDGWAVQEETSVFKDGEVVGLFASLTVRPGAQQWNLRYEWIAEAPSARDLLA
jgi:hypothetical protein